MASGKHIDKLNNGNYFIWAIRILDHLTIKDCKDPITDAEHPQSAKALAYIRSLVEDQYLPIIREQDTAKGAWDALAAVFQARSTACLLTLQRDLTGLKMESNETVC